MSAFVVIGHFLPEGSFRTGLPLRFASFGGFFPFNLIYSACDGGSVLYRDGAARTCTLAFLYAWIKTLNFQRIYCSLSSTVVSSIPHFLKVDPENPVN